MAHARRRCSAISEKLRRSLLWIRQYLGNVPRRVVPLRPKARERVIMYTDATGGGVLAYCILLPDGRKIYSSCRAPRRMRRWLRPRKTSAVCPPGCVFACVASPLGMRHVAAFELAAAVAAVHHALELVEDPEACCD